MGLFTYISGGHAECLKCGKGTGIEFQTKLFCVDAENSSQVYQSGSRVLIDGLDDYSPLYNWNETELLVVVFGDWDCDHCNFCYQSAKVAFKVLRNNYFEIEANIVNVEQFIPIDKNSFNGVHYIEDELALILDQIDKQQQIAQYPKQQFEAFNCLSIENKINRILKGEAIWAKYYGLDIANKIDNA